MHVLHLGYYKITHKESKGTLLECQEYNGLGIGTWNSMPSDIPPSCFAHGFTSIHFRYKSYACWFFFQSRNLCFFSFFWLLAIKIFYKLRSYSASCNCDLTFWRNSMDWGKQNNWHRYPLGYCLSATKFADLQLKMHSRETHCLLMRKQKNRYYSFEEQKRLECIRSQSIKIWSLFGKFQLHWRKVSCMQ